MRNRALFLAAIVTCGLAAWPVGASNTAFKLNYPCVAGNNQMGFPFFYYPDGNINHAVQTAKAACADLNTSGCQTKAIIEFRSPTPGSPETLVFTIACEWGGRST